MRHMIAIGLALVLPACGGGPNSPEDQIPNVAGTYVGPIAFTVGGSPAPTISARMVVVQAGSQVTITGTWTVSGQAIPLTALTGNVNATGFFTATSGGAPSSVDPTCGAIRQTELSITFSGNTLQYVERDSTQLCGNWTFSGTLTR